MPAAVAGQVRNSSGTHPTVGMSVADVPCRFVTPSEMHNPNSSLTPSHAVTLRWPLLLVGLELLALAGIYVALGLYFASYHAFWSPDSGARFAMVRSWVEHGSLVYLRDQVSTGNVPNELHPLGGYALHLPRGVTTTYPPLFPLLAGSFYRVCGFFGLTVLPLLSGLGTAALTTEIARRLRLASWVFVPVLLGLATPLVLYATVFWDHAVHLLLCAAGAYCALRTFESGNYRWGMGTGLALGIGVFFQELFIALTFALLLSGVPLLRRLEYRRFFMALALAFGVMVVLWLGVNTSLYGVPGGPHTLGPNQLTQPYHLRHILDPPELLRRASIQLVGDPAEGPLAARFGYLLAGLVVLIAAYPPARRFSFLGYAAGAVTAFILVQHAEWAHGLFQATPLLIPALLPPPSRGDDPPSGKVPLARAPFQWWLYRAVWLFTLMVVLNPLVPGMDWGSRYLLTALPLMWLLAASNVEAEWHQLLGWHRLAVALAVGGLLLVSAWSQSRGAAAIQKDLAEGRRMAQAVDGLQTDVLVTDQWWLGAELSASRVEHQQFLVQSPDDRASLIKLIQRSNTPEFVFYGSATGERQLRDAVQRARPPITAMDTHFVSGWTTTEFRVSRARLNPRGKLVPRVADQPR